MANNFKKVIDRQMWVLTSPSPNAHAAGVSICSDLRSDLSRNPFVYQLVSNTIFNRFNIVTKGWQYAGNPNLGGTFGAGAATVFAPSQALVGTIAAGATSSSVILFTALPTAVGANMLANRGGSGEYGYKIRIIGNSSGGSGKIEERYIIGNSAGTTPTIYLDNPLTFTPQAGDGYEILSGRVYFLGAGTTSFKSFEVASNTLANLVTTNLPATISTESSLIALDEQYTPYDCEPGDGFIKGTFQYDSNITNRYALTATATATNTLTGQASGGDASVLANEYRNFQIRIVQDTTTPTAVGQRRIIISHTAGASPVYTLGSNWTVNPSSTAKYVIEYPNLILLRSSGTNTVYTYNYNSFNITNGTLISSNTWSTTYFQAAGGAIAAGGLWMPSFGIRPDPGKNARHSYVYFFRGASAALDLLDIAGGTNGFWTTTIAYDGNSISTGAGTCGDYAPYENEGRFFYLNYYAPSALNQIYRFDVQNRVLSPFTPTDWIQSGTAAVGKRIATYVALDGSDKYDVVFLMTHTSSITQELIVQV